MTPECKPRRNGYMSQEDCAAHGTPWPCVVTPESWAAYAHGRTNPLFLSDPATVCPVCFTNLRDDGPHTNALRACPFGPHDERDYPPNGSAA